MRGPAALPLVLLLAPCLLAASVRPLAPVRNRASAPTSAPSTAPATTRLSNNADAVAFLVSLYDDLLKSPDWTDRGLALVSLSRLPGEAATDRLLDVAQKDKLPAVRVVAWQCVLSRAPYITPAQFRKWKDATSALVKLGAFRGQTRAGLLHFLVACGPTPGAKNLWRGIFADTSSLRQQDIPVLDALADCLVEWRSPELMKFLYDRMDVTDDQYRAEYVLHRAGCDAPWAGERSDLGYTDMWKAAAQNYEAWGVRHRAEWVEVFPPAKDNTAWRDLKPQYVPAADLDAPVDRYAPKWKKELELGRPDLRAMDVVFTVDATGSMKDVIDYLKDDVGRTLRALSLVSQSARLGLTFYRDQGDEFVTRSTRLTSNLTQLQAALNTMSAHGGGDRPEAVLEALRDALANNPWHWEKGTRRAVVLITDAPPHPQTQADCEEIARQCAAKGVTLYVIKATGDDVPELDAIAQAAGGKTVAATDLRQFHNPYPLPAHGGNWWFTRLATPPPDDAVDRQVLTGLLADAINPQFRDRVEPLVGILLALTTEVVPEKRELFGVANPDTGGPPAPDPQAR